MAKNAMSAHPALEAPPAPLTSGRSLIGRVLIHCLFLVVAAVAFAAHEHFRLRGQATQSLVSLLVAAGFALMPVRALVGELLRIEGKALHMLHGVGGLAVAGLTLGGVFSGEPLLTHAALAPFAMMGSAQAIMHQHHPRNAQQADALRRFATSLPEIEQLTKTGDLTSPANVAKAVSVLNDLLAKAQALGQTELQADPGFQSALEQVTTRFGLSLGLDTVDEVIQELAANPAASGALPGLRKQLADARKVVEAREGSNASGPAEARETAEAK
jgi:hypothetical protein